MAVSGSGSRRSSSGSTRRSTVAPFRSRTSHFFRSGSAINPSLNGFAIQWASGQDGFVPTTDIRPTVHMVPVSVLATPCDVQVQWAHFMDAFYWYDYYGSAWVGAADSRIMGADYVVNSVVSGSDLSISPPLDLDTNAWLVRARSGDGSSWGFWSAPITVSVFSVALAGAFYVDENVGVEYNTPRMSSSVYIDENVGMVFDTIYDDAVYLDLNVGIGTVVPLIFASEFLDENITPSWGENVAAAVYMDIDIDPSKHPVPHLWWVVPEHGQEGWIFHLFGHGFGQSQSEFAGRVLVNELQSGIVDWSLIRSSLQRNELSLTARQGTSNGNRLKVLLASAPVPSMQMFTGDSVVWEEYWDTPPVSNLGFGISFILRGTERGSFSDASGTDDNGMLLRAGTARSPAYKTWLRHSYTVVPADNGGSIGNFYLNFINDSTSAYEAGVRIRNVGVKDGTTGNVKWWALPPSVVSFTPPTPITAEGGSAIISSTVWSPDVIIDKGSGLTDQVILPEHGHLVVSVPDGAVSGPVTVRLTL